MLDEGHVDVAGQERELDGAQFVEGPALAAAARCDRFIPHGGHLFAQRRVLDLHQAREKLCDLFDTVGAALGCCHGAHFDFSRYF